MSVLSSWLNDHDFVHLKTLFIGLFLALLIDSHAKIRRMVRSIMARRKIRQLARAQSKSVDNDSTARTVAGLYIYPCKSMRATNLLECKIDARGLVGDRRFMVVCETPPSIIHGLPQVATHRFVTQRQCPALATINATLDESALRLSTDTEAVAISLSRVKSSEKSTSLLRARVWDDVVEVVDAGEEAAAFLQSIVDLPGVRLVSVSDTDARVANEEYVPPEGRTWTGGLPLAGLTDGFPILVACTASLEELNRRLVQKKENPIPMSRFRPNIVIQTSVPFEEDYWKTIQIDDTILHLVKACPRCKQSCTDQVSGKVSNEPLATLADFRTLGRSQQDVYFAQNAVMLDIGTTLKVGSAVKILKHGFPVWDKESVKAE